MNTIREEIILELIARAAVIVSTGSPQAYSTDIGTLVHRARTRFDPDDLPCVVVWPQEETAENKYGRSRHVMPVNIEGLMNFGSGDPSVIGEQMLGDLIKCFTDQAWVQMNSPAHRFESIEYAGGGTSAPYEGDKTVATVARFNVVYWTAIGDPYSQ